MQTHQHNPKETAAKTAPANGAKATRNPLQLMALPEREPMQKEKENAPGVPDGSKAGVETLSGYSTKGIKSAPIQLKFGGSYGTLLQKTCTPEQLGVKNSFYNTYWSALNDCQDEVKIEEGPHSYSQNKKTIYLKSNALLQLPKAEPRVKASILSSITHELSHAHDHIVMKREFKGGEDFEAITLEVLDTELRAWAREALTAHQISPGDLDNEQSNLLKGWFSVSADMINKDQVRQARKENAVIDRLTRYTNREMKAADFTEVEAFFEKFAVKLKADITRLSGQVKKTLSVEGVVKQ